MEEGGLKRGRGPRREIKSVRKTEMESLEKWNHST